MYVRKFHEIARFLHAHRFPCSRIVQKQRQNLIPRVHAYRLLRAVLLRFQASSPLANPSDYIGRGAPPYATAAPTQRLSACHGETCFSCNGRSVCARVKCCGRAGSWLWLLLRRGRRLQPSPYRGSPTCAQCAAAEKGLCILLMLLSCCCSFFFPVVFVVVFAVRDTAAEGQRVPTHVVVVIVELLLFSSTVLLFCCCHHFLCCW